LGARRRMVLRQQRNVGTNAGPGGYLVVDDLHSAAGSPPTRRLGRPLLDKLGGTGNCSCVRTICLWLVCALTLAGSVIGQGVGAVPPSDPVYRIIDRLDAAGLLDTLVRGQRPYSRREVLRLLF